LCETRDVSRTLVERTHSSAEAEILGPVHLHPVDSVDVTIVVDNTIDILLASKGAVVRPPLAWNWSEREQLVAEHGYSVLLTFHRKGESRSILYDAGLTPQAATHNLDALGIQIKDVDSIVLSHGHADHHGGLEGLIRKIGRGKLPLILHPDAWRNRKIVFPSGVEIDMPPPDRKALEREDVQLIEECGPSLLIGDMALVSGQVERVTDFEKGFPIQYAREGGAWTPDPWTWDDQAVVCNVNGKGLVVVSSCAIRE
jgi:7,8-dihydropterin-6-yl-methyl-4-(beta-D-ribofuranosyl)aminobenzene 5'-phosphate synthase